MKGSQEIGARKEKNMERGKEGRRDWEEGERRTKEKRRIRKKNRERDEG